MIKRNYFNISFLKLLIRTLSVINKKGKEKLINLIFLVIIQAFFDVLSLASLMPLIQILTNRNKLELYTEKIISNLNINALNNISISFFIPLVVILLMIITTVMRLYVVYKTNKFIEDTRHQISIRLMESYIKNNIKLNINSSEIAKSILSEVDQFIIIVFQPTILFLTNILVLFAIIFYLLFSNFIASIISLGLLLIFYIIFYIFSKRKLNFEGYKSENANKGRFRTAIESLQLIKDIKIYTAENYFSNRFKKFSFIFARTNSVYSTLVASPKYILEMIVFVSIAFAILFISLSGKETLNSLPTLGIFAFAAYKTQPALSNIIYGINSLEFGKKIISNLYLSLKKSNKIREKNRFQNFIYKENSQDNKDRLEIKNLSFIYNKNNNGIKNINLTIDDPSLFIIVGSSGAGKSTLLNILSGNLKSQKGEIYFYKKGYKKEPKISFLHQEYALYDASIAENVAFGINKDNIKYEKVKEVLIKSEIFDYVESLEDKLYEKVGENGCNLSIGQRQRIALARALYFNPDILLLDEPTSALDIKSEKKIINTILKLSKEIVVIMATHKINYIPNNTKVGYLNVNGIKVVEIEKYKKN